MTAGKKNHGPQYEKIDDDTQSLVIERYVTIMNSASLRISGHGISRPRRINKQEQRKTNYSNQ